MAERVYVRVTDATKGDYILRTELNIAQIYEHLGLTSTADLSSLADVAGRLTSASALKKAARGVELGVTVKSGTGATATWKGRKFFCPLNKISDALTMLVGKDLLGGKIVSCYAPRRADFR